MNKYLNTFTLGISLFILYILQYFIPFLKWNWLYELQQDQMFRRWSGLAILLLIVFQWSLTLTRVVNPWKKYAQKFVTVHKYIGVFSILIFYIHAMEFGYGYLLMLSIIFLANTLLGVTNLDVIKSGNELIFQGWMIAHVTLSILITFVMFFHVFVVFYYK